MPEKEERLAEAERDLANAYLIDTERTFKLIDKGVTIGKIDSLRLRRRLKFVAITVFKEDVKRNG